MRNTPSFPSEGNAETEKSYRSRVVLSIFRHGEKEKTPPPGKTGDEEVLLTPAGRKGAIEKGDIFRLPEEGMAQAVAIGSPRKRAQETAAFVMAGEEETVTGEETLEELKKKLDGGKTYGSKTGTSERLNFDMGSGTYEEQMMKAFKSGKFIEWLAKESDSFAESVNELKGSTYSRSAGNVAELVKNYLRAGKRFDELVKTKKYADTMQRFLGTHQSVGECFLAKVIEKTAGLEEREKFLQLIGTGFGFVEGFQIEIDTPKQGNEPKIKLFFRRRGKDEKDVYEFHTEITPELLDEIIEEGK